MGSFARPRAQQKKSPSSSYVGSERLLSGMEGLLSGMEGLLSGIMEGERLLSGMEHEGSIMLCGRLCVSRLLSGMEGERLLSGMEGVRSMQGR